MTPTSWSKEDGKRLQRASDPNDPCSVRVDGVLYFLGERVGGACYEVLFADGRIVQTTDLVRLGELPANLRAVLPDNATLRACP